MSMRRELAYYWKLAAKFAAIFIVGGGILGITSIEILRALGVHIYAGMPFVIGSAFTSILILLFGERIANWLLYSGKENECQEMVKHQNKTPLKKWNP